ncbi:hypothetical protein K439DRAFT_1656414 [Ramaria rubella]|nr:hypothetical protein K439DRAFT_1656414 [Ramaria rubella]
MADIQPSGTSIAAPVAAASIRDSSLGKGGEGNGEAQEDAEMKDDAVGNVGKVVPPKNLNADALLAGHDASETAYYEEEQYDEKPGIMKVEDSSVPSSGMSPISVHDSVSSNATAASCSTTHVHTPTLTAQSSPDAGQTHTQTTQTTTAQPQPHHAPLLKRFTSVNINKRFLEKTSSTSGTPLGGSPLSGHTAGVSNASGSGQRRGESPSSRPPSTDRPVSSRLVTAKLTAVPQPSAVSTTGWLRTGSSTPGNSTTPTPSLSPQPTAEPGATASASALPSQASTRRPGEAFTTNGTSASSSASSSTQQQGTKPVWGKVLPTPSKGGLGRTSGKEIQNDFPTAAEAAHGRKTKVMKAQLAAETAAAQTAAQKQAMIETAAAFRGAHLDANARHWDEMEDEEPDFLAGVIEFGDGTQYKIEQKSETSPSNTAEQPKSPPRDSTQSHLPVTKEERFGEDIGRSWPRARTSPVRSPNFNSLPPRPPPSQHPHLSPTESPASSSTQPLQDDISPTSRVLFNERSNRLEPWSNAKPRSGPPTGAGPTRRDSREEHLPFNSIRQPPLQMQGRDAPPHSHPSPANVQLLQKGPAGADSTWKGGPPKGFGHGPERGRWNDVPGVRGSTSARDEDPWELRSMSSSEAAGSSARERSRGRDGRWDTDATSHGREIDHERDNGRRNSNIGQPPPLTLPPSLARERSRDPGRQLPPLLSRMPPPPVPPMRGSLGRDLPPPASQVRPPITSPSPSVRSLLSPASEKAPSISSIPEGVDKDALVKDAMQLAIERARKRKQEGEAEEMRRLEAAERAKRKAEALAVAQEEKKKAEIPPLPESKPESSAQETQQLPAEPNGVEAPHPPKDVPQDKLPKAATFDVTLRRPVAPPARTVIPPPILPRRPSIPTLPTPASQADSWRNKAAPVTFLPPQSPQPLVPPSLPRGSLPPTTKLPELDLTLKPDENIEVVDFCDLGKLMDGSALPGNMFEDVPTRARRPVASDFFDDRPLECQEPPHLLKSDQPTWRRSFSKPVVSSLPSALNEDLGAQTMPIFSTEDVSLAKEVTSACDAQPPPSPRAASPSLRRYSSQCDQISSSSTSQSTHMSPAVLASRSPRPLSHFKEAPMATLTDTMSRIKGALDGMQTVEPPNEISSREVEEQSHGSPALAISIAAKWKMNDSTWGAWRDQRPEVSEHVMKILSPPPVRSVPAPRELFDVTCLPPPRSPKPAWNAFVVHIPKESLARDAISKKQLHFWNLPHSPVRWDILSWEPPVEGMNKRELSRDEIFHRKYTVKGGKFRVMLPGRQIVHAAVEDSNAFQEIPTSTPQHGLVTAAGVKIKLPPRTLSVRQNTTTPPQSVVLSRPRDSSVPSWRRSATPLTPLKKDRPNPTTVNDGPPDNQLNTTSRSPPPEPSTPLPRFNKPKSGPLPKPAPAQSATVSLPSILSSDIKLSGPRRPSGTDVAFFRTSRDPETNKNKPLPRFTVSSELDSGEIADPISVGHRTTTGGPSISIERSSKAPVSGIGLSQFVASNPPNKSSDDSMPETRSVTPPSTHSNSAWGKSPLSFSMKDSPARSAPDPEHLKAVWSQTTGRAVGSTSNSLKGIADDLPSIPFTVQDMKSEDGETPPPTAPAPPPSRLSLQEVTRAFQQVPDTPASTAAPRPPSYAQTPLLSPGSGHPHRSNQPVAISLPPQHSVRSTYGPYSHPLVGHSPSPTLMYAPGVPSPVIHHRMTVNGPSPPITHGMWLPTPPPPPTQTGPFMRPTGAPPPAQLMYPSPGPGTSPGAPGQMMHRRMSAVSPGNVPPPPSSMYPGHPMDMQSHMHARSPHLAHAHPMPHMHVGHVFSQAPTGQAPAMYAVPIGAGRGGMMPRPGYESYPAVLPHNASYQPVPSTSFVFQS